MPKILTTCAVTGKHVDTGIEIDEASFALLPAFTATVFCPYCRMQHAWSRDTAVMAEEEKPVP